MSRSEFETVYEDFNCSRLGNIAPVEIDFLVHHDGHKVRREFRREDCKTCGVRTGVTGNWTYDWMKCVHPQM